MHINVRDILAEELGYSRSFKITGEQPALENVKLMQPIEGEVTISRLDDGVVVQGTISTAIELECHRCLSTFTRPSRVSFRQSFTEQPNDEEMPITGEEIDLAPLIEQEIIVSLPIKIICRPDCPGVEVASERYTSDEKGRRIKDQARITKGP